MPNRFDMNEWFIIGTIAVLLLLFWIVRQKARFSVLSTLSIWLFTIAMVQVADFSLGGPPHNLYDFMDSPKVEFIYDGVAHFVLYPLFGVLFLHGWVLWTSRGRSKLLYLLAWTGLSVLYEWLSIIAHVLQYKNWQLIYSAPVYFAVFLLELALLKFLQRYLPMPFQFKG
jgi:hypothetical protein